MSFRVCKLWNAVIARPGYLASKKKYFQYRYYTPLILLMISPTVFSRLQRQEGNYLDSRQKCSFES
jgi:hypothetical protein